MADLKQRLAGLGMKLPNVELPLAGSDYQKWAVVACDQYSSEREYWESVAEFTGSAPSTLNLVFPECYLEDNDKAERVEKIKASMKDYLARGLLQTQEAGFVLVERYTPFEKLPRIGLVIAVDLESYQYGKDAKSRIRPTEGTIVERLPPRMDIRRGAPLELPHIMLLVDDPLRTVIEPLYAARDRLPKLYDFELMKDSGRIRGWHVKDTALLDAMADALEKIADVDEYRKKYNSSDLLLYAVGDGNHSLATAKAIWEETKAANNGNMDHPARYALVELVNIYDDGLPFHPIHRLLFNVDENAVLEDIRKAGGRLVPMSWEEAIKKTDEATVEHRFAYTSTKQSGLIVFDKPESKLASGTIQDILDPFLARHPDIVIDFIHGTESLTSLAMKDGNLGIYLPPIDKSSFFGTIINDGVMPRKTFSMGEAPEKRFYIEARKII